MNKIRPETVQRIEFFSIFFNNIFLLLGIVFFGWTLFETLFLYWLEPLSALLVLLYIRIRVPLKYGRPGYKHLPEYRNPAIKTVFLTFYTLIMHYFALLFIIRLSHTGGWETNQGVLWTLAQMPSQLWEGNLLFLTLLFLLAYLMPPILLERRGIKPNEETMPLQTKIMIHPSQFVINYIWFLLLWIANVYLGIDSPVMLVSILMLLKSLYEGILYFRIRNQQI